MSTQTDVVIPDTPGDLVDIVHAFCDEHAPRSAPGIYTALCGEKAPNYPPPGDFVKCGACKRLFDLSKKTGVCNICGAPA